VNKQVLVIYREADRVLPYRDALLAAGPNPVMREANRPIQRLNRPHRHQRADAQSRGRACSTLGAVVTIEPDTLLSGAVARQ